MADRTRAPWWLKPANQMYKVLLRRGITVFREHPVLLTVPGRKSGKPRSTPVTPLEVDGRRYVVAVYPAADWVANVRAADAVTATDGGRTARTRMTEVTPEEARPVLRFFAEHLPSGVSFLKRSGLVTDGTPQEVEALAGRLPVFRIDPIT